MSNKLVNLKPERVFYYFEELSKIPRESANEKAVSDFLVNTAKKLGLEVYQDKINNIVIKKPATKGYENSDGVILQGHMDMVCEKELDSDHNFKTDGIDLIIDGKFLRANKTTLGADNGIAVAMGLAILEDKNIEHPEIELLVTVEEETTMRGAMELEENILTGKMLINIDSEEEGWVTVGSAGGKEVSIIFNEEKEKFNNTNSDFYRLEVKNLFGGHSGAEIHKNRLNANKVMSEVISEIKKDFDIKLCDIKGGSKDNAIPRECYFDIAVDKPSSQNLMNKSKEIFENFKNKYIKQDLNITFEISNLENKYDKIYSKNLFEKVLGLLKDLPTGVNTWLKEYPDIVESSDNLAIIKVIDNKITVIVSLRSSEPTVLDSLEEKIITVAKKYNASYKVSDGYPEWRFKPISRLRDTAVKTYQDLFNEKMQVAVIHAGLECGAISMHYPNLDMISIGPNIYDVHTPKEKMEIASVEKYYKYLVELLKNLK